MAVIHQLPTKLSLDERLGRIQSLMDDWTNNTIAIGKELIAARDNFPAESKKGNARRPGWRAWLAKTGIELSHANKLISVAERFSDFPPSAKISRKVLMFLSTAIPDSGRKEVIKRIEAGEIIGKDKARRIVDKHRPKPAEANKQAKETGKAVLASDGYLYLGADKEDVKEATAKRTVIFAVRRAIETLASVEITPQQMLNMALPHQLLHLNEGNQIKKAAVWLTRFSEAWRDK